MSNRKGQESLLNMAAIVIVTSLLFIYFFYVTQSQKAESTTIYASQLKYKFAENALANMYYVQGDGTRMTYAEIISRSAGNVSYRETAEDECKAYLDTVLQDYDYFFFVENEDEKQIFKVNREPEDDVNFAAHVIRIPVNPGEDSVYAYLYVW